MTIFKAESLTTEIQRMDAILEKQKSAFLAEPFPELSIRINRLNKIHNILVDHRDDFAKSIAKDFSSRSQSETELAEILPLFEGIAYYRSRLKRLMKPQKRHTPLMLMPASVRVVHQPVGVVGIVVPWNFPLFLALSPLVGAIAAGNRAMLKTSEYAPHTGSLLQKVISENFSDDEIAVFTGGVDTATKFTQLPFDHLVFTGSTHVGRMVMKSAAENLTPVTLELGGKSPAIIHQSFPIDEAAKRIAFGKGINSGQVCVSPDYVLCPRHKINQFCDTFAQTIRNAYPTLLDNEDYTAIITEAQKERLQQVLIDAKEKGAELLTINQADEDLSGSRKLPMTLVLGATEDMRVLQEEIFGPILPILPYDDLNKALEYVNQRPRPLALYYFDWDKARSEKLLKSTHSGGVCINDTMSHVMADDIPFGGIGPSGIGQYHGEEGFKTFSKAKGVMRKGRINVTHLIAPPWGNLNFRGLLAFQNLRFRKRRTD